MKNVGVFVSENFQFLEMKFSIYLNRCVFVMRMNYMYVTSREIQGIPYLP